MHICTLEGSTCDVVTASGGMVGLIITFLVLGWVSCWVFSHPTKERYLKEMTEGTCRRMTARLALEMRRGTLKGEPIQWLHSHWEKRTKGTCISGLLRNEDFLDMVTQASILANRSPRI